MERAGEDWPCSLVPAESGFRLLKYLVAVADWHHVSGCEQNQS